MGFGGLYLGEGELDIRGLEGNFIQHKLNDRESILSYF